MQACLHGPIGGRPDGPGASMVIGRWGAGARGRRSPVRQLRPRDRSQGPGHGWCPAHVGYLQAVRAPGLLRLQRSRPRRLIRPRTSFMRADLPAGSSPSGPIGPSGDRASLLQGTTAHLGPRTHGPILATWPEPTRPPLLLEPDDGSGVPPLDHLALAPMWNGPSRLALTGARSRAAARRSEANGSDHWSEGFGSDHGTKGAPAPGRGGDGG